MGQQLQGVNNEETIRWAVSSPWRDDAEDGGTEKEAKVVAVVGLSSKPDRPSYRVAVALQQYGYRIVPVNPREREVLGETAYPDLASIPHRVDIIDVFRASEHTPEIAREAAAADTGARVFWLQEGIRNDEAANIAREAGMEVVMDRCIYKEILRIRGQGGSV